MARAAGSRTSSNPAQTRLADSREKRGKSPKKRGWTTRIRDGVSLEEVEAEGTGVLGEDSMGIQ
jgi:hypothetical protein